MKTVKNCAPLRQEGREEIKTKNKQRPTPNVVPPPLAEFRAEKELFALRIENERLRQEFNYYARHHDTCAVYEREPGPCTCGLSSALARAKGIQL